MHRIGRELIEFIDLFANFSHQKTEDERTGLINSILKAVQENSGLILEGEERRQLKPIENDKHYRVNVIF